MASFTFEASGKLKLPTVEELAKSDSDIAILAYTNGTTASGKPYYAYVAVKPSLYREFHALTSARKPIVLGDYGSVIVSGFEAHAPAEIVAEMRETYGFDDQYEEKLVQEARSQQSKSVEEAEDKRLMDIVTMLKRKSDVG